MTDADEFFERLDGAQSVTSDEDDTVASNVDQMEADTLRAQADSDEKEIDVDSLPRAGARRRRPWSGRRGRPIDGYRQVVSDHLRRAGRGLVPPLTRIQSVQEPRSHTLFLGVISLPVSIERVLRVPLGLLLRVCRIDSSVRHRSSRS